METGAEPEPDEGVAPSWPLPRVFDLIAVVFATAVVFRAIGGVVAAAGVRSLPGGYPASLGLSTTVRLSYGTGWADLLSGLLLLCGLGLVALPRTVWDVGPGDRGLTDPEILVLAIHIMSVVAFAASVIGTVNFLWHGAQFGPAEALSVGSTVAAAAVNLLSAVLSWVSLSYVRDEHDAEPDEG